MLIRHIYPLLYSLLLSSHSSTNAEVTPQAVSDSSNSYDFEDICEDNNTIVTGTIIDSFNPLLVAQTVIPYSDSQSSSPDDEDDLEDSPPPSSYPTSDIKKLDDSYLTIFTKPPQKCTKSFSNDPYKVLELDSCLKSMQSKATSCSSTIGNTCLCQALVETRATCYKYCTEEKVKLNVKPSKNTHIHTYLKKKTIYFSIIYILIKILVNNFVKWKKKKKYENEFIIIPSFFLYITH